MKRTISLTIAAFFVLSFAVAIAQEEAGTSAPTTAATDRFTIEAKVSEVTAVKEAVKGLKLEQEFRRRLPNGFGPLVNTTQRDQIYKIQEEYFEVIEMLKLRVKLLEEERDAKVDAVLTAEQQQRLNRPIRRILAR